MAEYAGDFLSGTILDVLALLAAIEDDLPAQRKHQQAAGSTVSTTSSSFSAIATESGLAVNNDEVLLILAGCSFSGSNAGDLVEFGIYVDSTELVTRPSAINNQTSTGGNRQSVFMAYPAENLSGTVSVTLQFRRVSGSGTLYATQRSLTVLKLKKRA